MSYIDLITVRIMYIKEFKGIVGSSIHNCETKIFFFFFIPVSSNLRTRKGRDHHAFLRLSLPRFKSLLPRPKEVVWCFKLNLKAKSDYRHLKTHRSRDIRSYRNSCGQLLLL